MTYTVSSGTLNSTIPYHTLILLVWQQEYRACKEDLVFLTPVLILLVKKTRLSIQLNGNQRYCKNKVVQIL